MEQKLFTESRMLYAANKDNPFIIRIKIQMDDIVDSDSIRKAVNLTMKRYPYFCVELKEKDGQYIFAENSRPVVITNDLKGVELNSKESNYHMISFSYHEAWIVMDVFHGMTDGTGAYEIIRTLLYYYCSEKYHDAFNTEGIRLVGDEIAAEEWIDPVVSRTDLPVPEAKKGSKALNLAEAMSVDNDNEKVVYSISASETAFMQFVKENESSPSTMVALLLSRAIKGLFPNSEDVIRVMIYVNQRKALNVPLAHQTLVGGAFTEYNDQIKDLPLGVQASVYRKMILTQTQDDAVLFGVATIKGINQLILSKGTAQEKVGTALYISEMSNAAATASVSYIGKRGFLDSEKHINDFSILTSAAGNIPIIEMSAVNGFFRFDMIQPFSSDCLVNSFMNELKEHGIEYKLQNKTRLELPSIHLPWN